MKLRWSRRPGAARSSWATPSGSTSCRPGRWTRGISTSGPCDWRWRPLWRRSARRRTSAEPFLGRNAVRLRPVWRAAAWRWLRRGSRSSTTRSRGTQRRRQRFVVGAHRDGVERAALGAGAALRALLVIDHGEVTAARPDALGVQQRRCPVREAAVRAAVADRVRIAGAATQVVGVREADNVRLAQDLDGALARDLLAEPAIVVETQADVHGLVAAADDRTAVAGPYVDVLLGGDDGLRLGQEEIRVVDLPGAPRIARLEGLEVVAYRGGVVVGRPVGQACADIVGDVAPALEHRADVEAVGEGGGRVRARLVAVEHGAAHGALEALRLDACEAGRPAGGQKYFDVVAVVEAVEPREDELGRADRGGDRCHRRCHGVASTCFILAHRCVLPRSRSPPPQAPLGRSVSVA